MNEMETKLDIQLQHFMEKIYLAFVESKCMPSEIFQHKSAYLTDVQEKE